MSSVRSRSPAPSMALAAFALERSIPLMLWGLLVIENLHHPARLRFHQDDLAVGVDVPIAADRGTPFGRHRTKHHVHRNGCADDDFLLQARRGKPLLQDVFLDAPAVVGA